MDIKIENATLEDREFIEKCFNLGLKEKHFYNTNFTDKLEIIIKNNGLFGKIFIIKDNTNTKAGFALCGINQLNTYEINMIYILKEFRNKKLAINFIKYYEKLIPNNKIIVRCDIKYSKQAIEIFKHLGYQELSKKEKTNQYEFMILEKSI
ncbi:TPA: GNAT family N-acetyltransferase [Campylobacter coli]|uniref:GNAT family N-acetyltransferase n=1 Tax=Campylobacter coli TaxID=195 RepID=UPI00069B5A87|nr:GNAT family N-acetyltransferase [Campylobacter coli]EAH7052158.1 N-acetyltransferase [Campylobacter coli]EGM8713524.1 GNAT family N-acetyltransferase [Campylobacter coli]EJN4899065.1 GNAT family N-acetyltransferase [Campylobacter coli]HEB8363762.1 GNAT family N-acetyltransferase [Campylobacter coli]